MVRSIPSAAARMAAMRQDSAHLRQAQALAEVGHALRAGSTQVPLAHGQDNRHASPAGTSMRSGRASARLRCALPAALLPSGLRRRGYSLPSVRIRYIRANPCSLPALRCKARLRVTQTPTVTLSIIGYRLSPIAYRLSPIAYRLSPIAYRLSATTFCSPAPRVPARSRAPVERRCCSAGLPGSAPLLQPV